MYLVASVRMSIRPSVRLSVRMSNLLTYDIKGSALPSAARSVCLCVRNQWAQADNCEMQSIGF